MLHDQKPVDKAESQKLISAPSISLPKGGGAIRAIGEKFAANPVTGTGSVTIPIATSPGRSGFGPQLSLSYDSGAGNGPFGLGWSLALPSITRKTEKGLPRYRDAEESDEFILSGAEDLVPVLVEPPDDEQSEEWEREKLPARTLSEETYRIERYRPRIEGLFARIERWTNQDDPADSFWRSISRDNITTWYGRTPESRIFDPADPSRIFSWLICESYDDKGNVVAYGYKREDSLNVDRSQAHEANRTDESRSANQYLKRIRYGNRQPYFPQLIDDEPWPPALGDGQWMFEVVLDYGEHDPETPMADDDGAWSCRHDPFSSYRAGFEVRAYRLCQRVLMFHHFPGEEGVGANCLVRSTDLTYRYEQDATDHRNPIHSVLTSVTQCGYKRQTGGGYLQQCLPPLEFEYSEASIDETIQDVEPESLENLPYGLDNGRYQWVDLDGEGVSGVLTEQAAGWFYKPNLSPVPVPDDAGKEKAGKEKVVARFAPVDLVAERPSLAAIASGHQQLLDLAGDGQLDLVALEQPTPGFYERTHDERWESFVPFASLPVLDWDDPNVKFVDLTGDGHADILVTEDEAFCWYPSLAEAGFGPAERVRKTVDDEKGPRLVFADGTQSVYLADLSGDGLTDLLRIRNGEVCYWPNLGYGRFGAKITMDNAPRFDAPDLFDQRRIRLADIDGTGVRDILYLGRDGVQIYFNQSGNGWSDARLLSNFPPTDNLSAVMALDLLGNGTACLLWSSPLAGDARRPMRYIDLMGGQKPHLLISVRNNLGSETHVQYAPSTKFYLDDKAAGTPWVTRLPFPVHVVERVETHDRISRNRFVTAYTYKHGYFDGHEREFRGFGLVEQKDTEEFTALSASGIPEGVTNNDEASHVPPVLTRTWFHTGVYLRRNHVSDFFAGLLDEKDTGEYYREPGLSEEQARELLLDDTILPGELTGEEEREACRALKGSMLRQEVYALDGSGTEDYPHGHPYTITEQSFTIRVVQPRGGNRHAVFFTHAREAITYHYERRLAPILNDEVVDQAAAAQNPNVEWRLDPRVQHALTLEVDRFGNVLKEAAIGYGRRWRDSRLPTDADRDKQTETLVTYTENRFTTTDETGTEAIDTPDAYRTPLPCETRTYELTGYTPTGAAGRFQLTDLEQIDTANPDGEIPYEDDPTSGEQRRLIEHVRTLYRPDDCGAAEGDPMALLPFGALETLALAGETYKLAFTPGLLDDVYVRGEENLLPNPSSILGAEGGYIDLDQNGHWWIPSGRVFFHPDESASAQQELEEARKHFFVPRRFRDPFQQNTIVTYDAYDLLLLDTEDALGNRVTAGLRDEQDNAINGNDYRVLQPTLVTDPNGAVSEVRFDALGLVVGTAIYKGDEGDSFETFETDLSQSQRDEFFADPKGQAAVRLGTATTRIIYDVDRYYRTGDLDKPAFAAALARETHTSDPLPLTGPKVQVSFSYSDGFGREIQKKIQAEPGPLVIGGPDVDPRWVSSGWTIFNNKGKPVRKYEPFFDDTHDFKFGKTVGVSAVLFYDPVERIVATLHPNHTYEKVVFDAWQQTTFDVNDTVLEDPRTDADIVGYTAAYFASLPASPPAPPWQTWYAQRQGGALGVQEQTAASKATAHAGTPTTVYFDTLGRTFLTIADNGPEGQYETRLELDIEGNQQAVIDAKDRVVMRYDYDMLGNQIRQASVDAGTRWMLSNLAGNPIRAWDSRHHEFRTVYDALQRPTHRFVGLEVLADRTVYGDSPNTGLTLDETQASNLRGKPYLHYDGAGAVTSEQYDFKGNLLSSIRQLANDYTERVNWLPLAGLTDVQDVQTSAAPFLESESFTTVIRYDALNRATSLTTPDSSETRPTYNEAGLLEQIDVRLRGASTWTPFVVDIDYDAKGQRELIDYRIEDENGAPQVVRTTYAYDPLTFRLSNLDTRRTTDNALLQDLHYTYDPVGNITAIRDQAQKTIFHDNTEVRPEAEYDYDALYRLISANGREHIGQNASPQPDHTDNAWVESSHPNDPQAMRNYFESYDYDEVGNILRMIHQANGGSWTRHYEYAPDSNRLLSTSLPGDDPIAPYSATYDYDPHGSMTRMPHLPEIEWDFDDQMQQADLGGGGAVYFAYDAAGQRVRKVHEHIGATVDEHIYVGGCEVYRRRNGTGLTLGRERLHVMDDTRRIALVETRTHDGGMAVVSPSPVVRYQLGNHLDSASLELDASGAVISYEEYHPYGTTSYRAGRSLAEASLKRYRYTGKERDEETSLYYSVARYYAPWLGRWTAADPAGLVDGPGLYTYCKGSPVTLTDPNGNEGTVVEELHRRPSRASVESASKSEGGAAAGSGSLASRAAPKRREITETVRPRKITEEGPSLTQQLGRAIGGAIERAGGLLEEKKAPPAIEAFGEHSSMAAKKEDITGVDIAMGVVGLVTAPVTAGPALVIAGVKGGYNLAAGTSEVIEAETPEQRERGLGRAAAGAVDVLMFAWTVQGATSTAAPKITPSARGGGGGKSGPKPPGARSWTEFLPEAQRRVAATKQRLGLSSDIVNMEKMPNVAHTNWSSNAHKNAYRSTADQNLYAVESGTGKTLKYGTAKDLATRYSPEAFAKFGEGARLIGLSKGNVRTIRAAERQLIQAYEWLHGHRPPFNKAYH